MSTTSRARGLWKMTPTHRQKGIATLQQSAGRPIREARGKINEKVATPDTRLAADILVGMSATSHACRRGSSRECYTHITCILLVSVIPEHYKSICIFYKNVHNNSASSNIP